MRGRLTGRLAYVTLDEGRAEAVARALAAEGATVVLITSDAARGGSLADEIRAGGGARVAVFCSGDPAADIEALVELGAELAPPP